MAEQRLPKRKYLRQLRDMRDDFRDWAYRYRESAELNPVGPVHDRLLTRAEQLRQLADLLGDAFIDLETLPRLA